MIKRYFRRDVYPASQLPWSDIPYRDRLFQINISRNVLIAVVISLLLHAVLFFGFVVRQLDMGEPPANESPTQLEVQLAPPPKSQPPAPVALAEPEPTPPPQAVSKKTTTKKVEPASKKHAPAVMTANTPSQEKSPLPINPNIPKDRPEAPPSPPPTDMMSYVNAQRERRRAQGDPGQLNEDAAAKDRAPTEDEIREANIRRNLTDGGGGVFQITQIGPRGARFVFRGWKYFSNPKTEYFEVENTTDGDIRLAIIRKMIEVIRRERKGDFPWESHRLGRTVTLSARPEDNAGLEKFLLEDYPWPEGNSLR